MIVSWNLFYYVPLFFGQVYFSSSALLKNNEDLRRPIWNIAHMVNSISQVHYYVDKGANSLEFDVTFDANGIAKYTYHGMPCDCFRYCLRYEDFTTYIDYLRQVTTPGDPKFRDQLVLLYMDVKVYKLNSSALERAGADITEKLIKYYWQNGTSSARAYILISVPLTRQEEFVRSILKTLMKSENNSYYLSKIGVDFSGNENLDSIIDALKKMQITSHVWQGDGTKNCWKRDTNRLREVLKVRDDPGPIEKVYWWTVDRTSTMRSTLRLGVDGMITNHPNRLYSVLKEKEFSRNFRLATIEDSPWEKFSSFSFVHPRRGGNLTSKDLMNEEDEIIYNI